MPQRSDTQRPAADPVSEQPSRYEDFLLAEYQHIANAHFNIVDSLTRFFQYYLIIASVGLSLLFLVMGKQSESRQNTIDAALGSVGPIGIPLILSLLSVVGLAVMGYITSLRCDAILYARTINGIRKYFMDRSAQSMAQELGTRVLPRSVHLPSYYERWYFDFVVAAFMLIDAFYAASGWWIHLRLANTSQEWPLPMGIAGTVMIVHYALYAHIAAHRESGYLRGHTIGVDIDGVLGRHRQQFSEVLRKRLGKTVNPKLITRLPIHECGGLGVTEEDANCVFHTPEYWTEMPSYDDASYVLKRLHDQLHYRIVVFSWRPWPNWSSISAQRRDEYRSRWKRGSIVAITRKWLLHNAIPHDKLIIERGNVDSPDRVGKTRNRFIVAQREKIRIFVEDDQHKARKLADTCEIVFLMKHPYNMSDIQDLPKNVIAVDDWQSILRFVRENL